MMPQVQSVADPAPLSERLLSGLDDMAISLPSEAVERLVAYVLLLVKWNRAYNLTAVRDPMEMVTKHLLDSLSILPELPSGSLLDVGSGAGLPGIPLAIAEPERPVTLLDTNGKKTRFLTQAVTELGLANVKVVQSRVEDYRTAFPFCVVTTRAFSTLADMLEGSRHLLAPEGRLLAMKGARPEEELAAIPPEFSVLEVKSLAVPGLQAERHLVQVRQQPRNDAPD